MRQVLLLGAVLGSLHIHNESPLLRELLYPMPLPANDATD